MIFGLANIAPGIHSAQGVRAGRSFVLRPRPAQRGCERPGPPAGTLRFDLAADPQTLNPLFLHPDAASVEAQLARLAFEPFFDLEPAGRPVPALLERLPSRANGDLAADGRTIRYRLRPHAALERRPSGYRRRRALHAARDPRSAQSGALARRVRSHRPRRTRSDLHVVVFHLKRAWAPAVMTYFRIRRRTAVRAAGARFAFAGVLSQELRSTQNPNVGDGPYRFVSWRRGEGLRYAAELALLARAARGCIALDPNDPGSRRRICCCCRPASWIGISLRLLQLAALRGDPRIAFVAVPTAVVAGLAMNTQHAPLERRERSPRDRDVDRPRQQISSKITLGIYPVTDMIQPQFSWAFDRTVREPAYDPARADANFRRGGMAARRRTGCGGADGTPLRLVYVAVSRIDDRRTRCRRSSGRAARSRHGRRCEVGEQRAALFPADRRVGNRQLRSGLRAVDAWAPIPTIRRCCAAPRLRTICAGATRASNALEARALVETDRLARKRLYREIGTHRCAAGSRTLPF